MAQGGIFGGLGYQPLGWENAPVDNAAGSVPASDPSVFTTGSTDIGSGGLANIYANPSGYDFPGFGSTAGTYGLPGSTAIPGTETAGIGSFYSPSNMNMYSFMNPSNQTQITQMGGFATPADEAQAAQESGGFGGSSGAGTSIDTSGAGVDTSSGAAVDTSSGSAIDTSSGTGDFSSSAGDAGSGSGSSSMAGGGGGQGMPINLGLQSSTTQFISGTAQQIEGAFGSGMQTVVSSAQSAIGTAFAGISNTLLRSVLIVVGVLVVVIALWRILFPDQTKEILAALPALAHA